MECTGSQLNGVDKRKKFLLLLDANEPTNHNENGGVEGS